jgi:UDP:flavonoid glycosyltransferase YjiC (YdhE family)
VRCKKKFSSSADTKWLKIIVLYQDLQKYLDEAPEGVIYFSLGSILRSTSMSESKKNAFLGAFSKLKQRVLWKWESDTLPGQPSNVRLGKWLPQSDILGECYYTGKTVGISCMLGGTYWRQ